MRRETRGELCGQHLDVEMRCSRETTCNLCMEQPRSDEGDEHMAQASEFAWPCACARAVAFAPATATIKFRYVWFKSQWRELAVERTLLRAKNTSLSLPPLL